MARKKQAEVEAGEDIVVCFCWVFLDLFWRAFTRLVVSRVNTQWRLLAPVRDCLMWRVTRMTMRENRRCVRFDLASRFRVRRLRGVGGVDALWCW